MDINLLPWREEIIDYNRKMFSRLMLLAVMCAGIFLIFAYHLIFAQLSYEKSYTEALESAKMSLVGSVNAYLYQKKNQKELDDRFLTLQKIQIDRFDTVRLLNTVAKNIPRGMYLTKLSRNQNMVEMSGVADSNLLISKLMGTIEALPNLKVISLEKVEKTEGKNLVVTQFDLLLNVIAPPAQSIDASKTTVKTSQ